jgi:hypothetical protein
MVDFFVSFTFIYRNYLQLVQLYGGFETVRDLYFVLTSRNCTVADIGSDSKAIQTPYLLTVH